MLPEWMQEASTAVLMLGVTLFFVYKIVEKITFVRAKRRNANDEEDVDVPPIFDRRRNSNPVNAGTTTIVARIEALENRLCDRLAAMQTTLTEIRQELAE